jgi:hypothetical protein
MEMSDLKTPPPIDPPKIIMDDIIDDLFHDAQNSIHRVGMELELASMGLADKSDGAKNAEMIKSLENDVRDLRAYISSMQNPSATCDPAAVLEGVVANLQIGHRNPTVQVSWIAPESLPPVPMHRKLLARVLERVLDFYQILLQPDGELRIATARRESHGQSDVEITFTALGVTPPTTEADKKLSGDSSNLVQIDRGANRALEVLRRHRGEIIVRKIGECQCEVFLRMPASPP